MRQVASWLGVAYTSLETPTARQTTPNFGSIPGTRGFPRTFQFMAKAGF